MRRNVSAIWDSSNPVRGSKSHFEPACSLPSFSVAATQNEIMTARGGAGLDFFDHSFLEQHFQVLCDGAGADAEDLHDLAACQGLVTQEELARAAQAAQTRLALLQQVFDLIAARSACGFARGR